MYVVQYEGDITKITKWYIRESVFEMRTAITKISWIIYIYFNSSAYPLEIFKGALIRVGCVGLWNVLIEIKMDIILENSSLPI